MGLSRWKAMQGFSKENLCPPLCFLIRLFQWLLQRNLLIKNSNRFKSNSSEFLLFSYSCYCASLLVIWCMETFTWKMDGLGSSARWVKSNHPKVQTITCFCWHWQPNSWPINRTLTKWKMGRLLNTFQQFMSILDDY